MIIMKNRMPRVRHRHKSTDSEEEEDVGPSSSHQVPIESRDSEFYERKQRRANPRSWTRCKENTANDRCRRSSFNSKLTWTLKLLCIIFTFAACVLPSNAIKEVRCGTIDIRISPHEYIKKAEYGLGDSVQGQLTSCTVVEGSFVIALIRNDTSQPLAYPRFEHLREITGSLLVFDATGLRNLSSIFPNLRVIGGQHLIQHYALIVYQNNHLEELGLDKLTLIRNGGVRITGNRLLCHANSIDWKHIVGSKLNDVMVDNAVEASFTETGKICPEGLCEQDSSQKRCRYTHSGQVQSCWNSAKCQKLCEHERDGETIGPGCDPKGERCHDECVGGCEKPGDARLCYACRHLNYQGRCIPKCPANLYSLLNRRCVSKDHCNGLKAKENVPLKAINGICSAKCPENYEEDPNDPKECIKCKSVCQVTCPGNVTIDNYAKAQSLKGCHIIDGYLNVEIRMGLDPSGVAELGEAFSKIHTIKGYLTIFHTPSFVNLYMFKNLRRITGDILQHEKYSLSVFENVNLKKLFNPTINLVIDKGYLRFHNNRMLCFHQIRQLMEKMGRETEMSDVDQSMSSNGDKAICEDATFEVKVVSVSYNTFVLEWPAFNTTDMDHRKFLGYEVYYKEVPKVDRNMSIDDDRSACSDSWYSEFIERAPDENEKEPKAAAISNQFIKPHTIYAYYVSTQIVHHNGARNAISAIGFVQTNFTYPEPPRDLTVSATTDTISLKWDPPTKPNGVITHYIVSWRRIDADLEYYSQMACDAEAQKLPEHSPDSMPSAVGEAIPAAASSAVSTTAPTLTSFLSMAASNQGTCSKVPGCCECAKPAAITDTEESSDFENELQNEIFVQSCEHHWDPERCRHWKPQTDDDADTEDAEDDPTSANATKKAKRSRPRRASSDSWEQRRQKMHSSKHTIRNTLADYEAYYEMLDRLNPVRRRRSIDSVDKEEKEDPSSNKIPSTTPATKPTAENFVQKAVKSVKLAEQKRIIDQLHHINITAAPKNGATTFVITGLKHYAQYSISVSACQNVSVPDNYCSYPRRLQRTIRTKKLPEVDEVRNETIRIEKLNSTTSTVRITWQPPEQPNGGAIGYKVTLVNTLVESAPHHVCQSAYDGNWTAANDGILFKGLADGNYRVELRTISMAGLSAPTVSEETFNIYTPGFWTLKNIFIALACLILFLLIAGTIAYYFVRKYYGAKVKEYATQLISANPDYLSQQDVYKPDEWELKRSDVTIQEEIGHGTFGSVFRGLGNNVTSQCGVTFGTCAIKTVTDAANNAERLHFLLEAHVMKTFNSSFIVKLYGVVSDGQPVLVVMEMMAKGNLRDYLRSRRPGADENKENLPVPTKEQYYEWAAQIADGMAYLESIKFCHRDLAARNCMVHANDEVKIGDFGMARDLYYHEYYKPTGKRLMPVRWMAPESLKDGKFDSKSDIWSYGIVLYEMLTLGQQPYQGLGNEDILEFIGMSRKVLERPQECPEYWYQVMRLCWKYQPRERPTFSQLVRVLAPHTSQKFHELSSVMNSDYDLNEELPMIEGDSDEEEDDYVEEPAYVQEPGRAGQAIQMREFKKNSRISLLPDGDQETDAADYMRQDLSSQGNGPPAYCTSNRRQAEHAAWDEGDHLQSSPSSGDFERIQPPTS